MNSDEPDADPIEEFAVRPPARPAAPPPPPAGTEEDLAGARERVLASLRAFHSIPPKEAFALIGGGAVVVFLIGLALCVVLWFVQRLAFGDGLSIRTMMLLYFLCLIPVFIIVEKQQRNGFFSFKGSDVDLTRDADSRGEMLVRRTASHLNTLRNAFWFGPRAIVAGVHALIGVPQGGLERVLPEAADTLTLLMSIDGAVKLKDLAPPGTDPMELMPVLAWLDTQDYIGISTAGDRVWVSTPAKKRFAAQGIFASQVSVAAK